MTKDWTIYKIINPIGKVYIGKTSNFKKRMNTYKNNSLKSQKLLYNSFIKYGFENHRIDVVDKFNSNNNYADGKEMFWIKTYMSNEVKWRNNKGLNLTDGGQGTIGYKFSDESRIKLSEAHKGLPSSRKGAKVSEETKQKLREYNLKNKPKGRGKWTEQQKKDESIRRKGKSCFANKGRKASEETKLKISLAKKGKPAWNKGIAPTKEAIEKCKETKKTRIYKPYIPDYSGLTKEQKKEKFGKHNIGNSYNKGRKHPIEYGKAMSKARLGKPNMKNRKPIFQYSLDGVFVREFDSAKSASESTGVNVGTIRDILSGGIKNPSTFIFKFKNS